MKKNSESGLVLLVDDDSLLRDMYARKFREKGLRVEALGSVTEALERLRGGLAPSLIAFDIVLPTLDGFDFLKHLAQEGLAPRAVKVALTNQVQDEDREKAFALGAEGYIIKANTTPSSAVEEVLRILREKENK